MNAEKPPTLFRSAAFLYTGDRGSCWVARRRPTLPQLELQYHGRWGVSRPSSGWDRVYHPRDDHRATEQDPGWGDGMVGVGGWVCVVCAAWCCVRC